MSARGHIGMALLWLAIGVFNVAVAAKPLEGVVALIAGTCVGMNLAMAEATREEPRP